MSLFGGNSSALSSSSHDSGSDVASQVSGHASSDPAQVVPPSNQDTQLAKDFTESDFDDDLNTDSDLDLDALQPEQTRPNRFTGGTRRWLQYTYADRQIATALDQRRDTDLAAHLYNAHALKRRARKSVEELAKVKSWQSRDLWLKRGHDLQFTDASGEVYEELVPPKDWTAWPLPPSSIPKPYKQPGRRRAGGTSDGWSAKNTDQEDAGNNLREELQAVFLRLAKEQWNARVLKEELSHESGRTKSPIGFRSHNVKSSQSQRSAPSTDTEMKDETQPRSSDSDDSDTDGRVSMASSHRSDVKRRIDQYSPATFLADDERAWDILKPIVQSTLSKFDDLALAIRRTRFNHFGRGGDSDLSSLSGLTTDAETTGPGSRSTSKSRSKSVTSRKSSTRPLPHETLLGAGDQEKSTKVGSRKATVTSDSGSEVFEDSDKDQSMSNAPLRKRSRSQGSASNSSCTNEQRMRAGLMDWSEVLSLAAMKGWDQKAIARAAQRSANLFGESMSFVHLDEVSATTPIPAPTVYAPSLIPPLQSASRQPTDSVKRPYFQSGTLRCPHEDCFGYKKDFAMPYRVVEHCIRVHKYDPRTNDSDNEERKVGGVHIDGFMQPITLKPGWGRRGKSRSGNDKKRLNAESEEAQEVTDKAEGLEEESGYV